MKLDCMVRRVSLDKTRRRKLRTALHIFKILASYQDSGASFPCRGGAECEHLPTHCKSFCTFSQTQVSDQWKLRLEILWWQWQSDQAKRMHCTLCLSTLHVYVSKVLAVSFLCTILFFMLYNLEIWSQESTRKTGLLALILSTINFGGFLSYFSIKITTVHKRFNILESTIFFLFF